MKSSSLLVPAILLLACAYVKGDPPNYFRQGYVPIAGNVLLSGDGNFAIIFPKQTSPSPPPLPMTFTRSNGTWTPDGNIDAGIDWTQSGPVALSGDGKTIVVGMPLDTGNAGSALILVNNNSVWIRQGQKLVASDESGPGLLGDSVAISNDGNTVALGAPFDSNGGGAWIFTRNAGVWSQQGNRLFGAGFEGAFHPNQGIRIALSGDGNTLITTDLNDANGVGAAWIFVRVNGAWSQQGPKLTPSDAAGLAILGASVALSGDGNTAILGGPGDNQGVGAAWIFVRANGVWTQQGPKLVGSGALGQAAQGNTVAISADGNTAVTVGPADDGSYGAFWVFTRSDSTWSQLGGKFIGAGVSGFGQSVGLSADGTTIAVGGPSVWFFALSNTAPATILTPSIAYTDFAGGHATFLLTVNPSTAAWTATSNASWLTVLSASSGTGSTSVTYSVAQNTLAATRTGTITIAGRPFTVVQSGTPQTFTISPTSTTAFAIGGTGTITITANPPDAPWTATSNASWITITSATSGSGSGTVTYSVTPNPLVTRIGSVTVAGLRATITQAGMSAITSYPTDGPNWAIVNGPDGALWFTTQQGSVDRITLAGAITSYPLSAPGISTHGITVGPDGAIWFTAISTGAGLNFIGRMTTSGVSTLYPLARASGSLLSITSGPDGALWFTELYPPKIGRITTAGVITEFDLPSQADSSEGPRGITSGPDGALWFSSSYVGRITTSGNLTQFPLQQALSGQILNATESILTGADGALWFGLTGGPQLIGRNTPPSCSDSALGRITTSGQVSIMALPSPGPRGCGATLGLTQGADGVFWVSDNDQIIRVEPNGVLTFYQVPLSNGIAIGSDGAIWLAESGGIGRFAFASATPGLAFYPITPCRVMDTRGGGQTGPFGPPSLAANSTRVVPMRSSSCGIPTNAQAYSLNVTAVPPQPLAYLTLWSGDTPQPLVSTLNSYDGAVVANAAIVAAGSTGNVVIFASDPTDVIIDINGYFAPPASQGLVFYPATPCRVVDTRAGQSTTGPYGPPPISAGQTRSFPIAGACNIPTTAQAYSVNVTAVPHGVLTFLTAWPSGQPQPLVSTLNSDGRVVANAANIPAGTNGAVNIFASDATDVIIDVNGYFAPPGGPNASYFYPLAPCRAVDTRAGQGTAGAFGPPNLTAGATRVFPLGATCGEAPNAQAFSLNFTVVPPGPLTYLTAWPQGVAQPFVSTLNSYLGRVVANAAVVPAGTSGNIAVFVTDATALIVDTNGYFAH